MPDARPSSDFGTLDITELVSGATSTANAIPSKVCGAITPKISEASWATAIQT